MAEIAVSISVGVMKPLLKKIATLMGEEYKKLKGLQKEVSFLKHELSDMNALLERMSDADELDPQAKKWRKDIIEMSYDIEDYIDDFINHVGEAGNNVGVLQKASHYLRNFKQRRRLASQFEEIKTLVIDAGKRRKRYMLDECIPSIAHVAVDPRLPALYQASANLVGIDRQKEEIVRWVMDEGKQLKVMSIVGFGGLGKTTLAHEVYREVGGEFGCMAFISISQNPDIVKLLKSLMSKFGLKPDSHACEPQDLIDGIIKHIRDIRYFIVVDDLWDVQAWSIISCAFPQNNHQSRVIITTRIEKVAEACCRNLGFFYRMKPLSEQDSRKLFFRRIFGSEGVCPPDLIGVSHKIFKKCGGLPLAIITMASMIACQPTRSQGQWAEYIQNFLVAEFETNQSYKDMMHILDFSYKNLPHHLKACFLYLGIYPEDSTIERVELLRRWVAEGFVSCSRGQDVWAVAESYFCELVNRSMIQPEYEYDDDKVNNCRVHDMTLELILRKCREDNFITLIDAPETMFNEQDRVIRRLTVDLRDEEGGITIMANTRQLSHVRSLNIFRGNCCFHNLAEFKHLRLLFLDVSNFQTVMDLTGINHLLQLRYLRVRGYTSKILLPDRIQGLRLLEILDFYNVTVASGEICGLTEIVDVPCLSHLFMSGTKGLPDGIGKARSLLTLKGFNLAASSAESITGLGELTTLSELSATYYTRNIAGIKPLPVATLTAALSTCLKKLGNLKRLELGHGIYLLCGDAIMGPSYTPTFIKLEVLDIRLLIFSNVPRWISHLCYLRRLYIQAKQIYQEDFNIIGTKLPFLLSLSLVISCIPMERIMIGASTGFKALEVFTFNCDGVSCLTFEEGAMPDLALIRLYIDPYEWDKATPVGLQHLPSLKKIGVQAALPFGKQFRENLDVVNALMRVVFQEAADSLPTRPAVYVLGGEWTFRPTNAST